MQLLKQRRLQRLRHHPLRHPMLYPRRLPHLPLLAHPRMWCLRLQHPESRPTWMVNMSSSFLTSPSRLEFRTFTWLLMSW